MTAQMRRLAWTFATRIGDKYQIRLKRSRMIFLPVCSPPRMKYIAIFSLDYIL